VLDGSVPASAEPSRIEKNGTAMMSITSVATTAKTAGRLLIASVQRTHAGDSTLSWNLRSFSALRSRRRGTIRPIGVARSAGSSVSAASTVNATVTVAAMATP
jgi:hypothetical protein